MGNITQHNRKKTLAYPDIETARAVAVQKQASLRGKVLLAAPDFPHMKKDFTAVLEKLDHWAVDIKYGEDVNVLNYIIERLDDAADTAKGFEKNDDLDLPKSEKVMKKSNW